MFKLSFFSFRVNLAFLIGGIALVASPLEAGDWPSLRGPDGDGISKEEKLPTEGSLAVKWTREVGLGYSAPIVSGGKVILSGHDGQGKDTLYCLDANSGEEIWTFSYDQPLGDLYFQGGTTGSVTVDGDQVYHVAREGELFCLNLEDGSVLWQKNLQKDFGYSKPTWGFTGAPLIRGDWIYVTAGEAGLALKKSDGSAIWKSEDEECGYAAPAPLTRNGKNYLIFSNKRFYVCVDAQTGEKVWEHRWMTRYGVNAADPIVTEDAVFLSSGYGKGAVLLKWTGEGDPERVWQSRDLRTQMNAALLIHGFLYGIDGNESVDGTGLKCLKVDTGEVLWTDDGVGHGTVSGIQDQLVVLTEDGDLQIGSASPEGFSPDLQGKVLKPRVWTVPVVANGTIFCRNAGGTLVAVGVENES